MANGGGVSNGKAKKVRETGDGGGGREGGPSDKSHRGSLRERLVEIDVNLTLLPRSYLKMLIFCGFVQLSGFFVV